MDDIVWRPEMSSNLNPETGEPYRYPDPRGRYQRIGPSYLAGTVIRIDGPTGTEIQAEPGMFRMSTAEEIRVQQGEYEHRVEAMRRRLRGAAMVAAKDWHEDMRTG